MPRLDIALLGPPEISLDGRPIKTERRKAVALLAYLAVTARAHTREHLAALLWPGYTTASAHAYLRRTLWELNQMLGKGWVEADRERASLARAGDLRLDTEALEASLSDPRAAPAALASAAALYRDDFTAGFSVADTAPFETWQAEQTEGFRRQFAAVLEKLVETQAAAGQHEAALAHARRWLALDALNEAAQRAAMRLLAVQGDRAGAIRQYEDCRRVLKAELGIEPEADTVALYDAILRGEVGRAPMPAEAPDAGAPSANGGGRASATRADKTRAAVRLPASPTPFIGRRSEVERIKALLLHPEQRLVSLIGPGGAGKTRLSIQAAAEAAEAFPDGVYFAGLAPLQAADALLPALARALDFSFYREGESHRQQLLDFLCEKRLLLILDNFEHLLEAADVVVDILARAPGVKLVATSRVRLNVQGEQLYLVGGMRTPDIAETEDWDDPEARARPFSAVQLFVERARRVQPGFALTRENVGPVLDICRLVHGMPLGLELAAAWLELLPPVEIASEIARSLDFLATDQPDVPARQRSIRAVFESSWKLLSQEERESFCRLCVFVGSSSRAAAQQVSGASLRTLLALANKSWLQQTETGRFQLHELMRQYGLERLKALPEAWQAANTRHADYFAAFAEVQSRRMMGPEQLAGLTAMQEEFETNLKTAWEWLLAERRWQDMIEKMCLALYQFGTITVRADELIFWLRPARQALEQAATRQDRAALAIMGTLEVMFEEGAYVKDATPEVRLAWLWQMAAEPGLAQAMGFWHVVLTSLAHNLRIAEGTGEHLAAAVARLRDQGQRWQLGIGLLMNANWWYQYGMDEDRLLEAERIFAELGVTYERGVAAEALGRHAIQQKRPEAEITAYFEQAQRFYETLGGQAPAQVAMLAGFYLREGKTEKAFALFREEQRIFERRGNKRLLDVSLHWQSLHAARFGSFEHALETRLRCIEIGNQTGIKSQKFWHVFELGEIYRIFDRWEEALPQYAEACREFEQISVMLGLAFCQRAQGDYAMHQRRYADALSRYEAFMRFAQQDNHPWSITQARGALALAQARMGQMAEARRNLRPAVAEAHGWGEFDLALYALRAEMVCLLNEGEFEQAAEMAAFMAHHPASWNDVRREARGLLEEAARHLPAAAARAAIERGQGLTLDAVAARIAGAEPPDDQPAGSDD